MMKTIGIGMTIFNEQNYIEKTLESILAQTYKKFRVVIYDDKSTDKTLEICSKLISGDSRFSIIEGDSNRGNIYGFTKVFSSLDTDYFMWLSGHDLISSNYIENALLIFQNNPLSAFVYPRIYFLNENGSVGEEKIFASNTLCKLPPAERFIESIGMARGYIPNNGIFNRELISNFVSKQMPRFFLAWDHVLFSLCCFWGIQVSKNAYYYEREFPNRSTSTYTRQTGYTNSIILMKPSWFELTFNYLYIVKILPLKLSQKVHLFFLVWKKVQISYNFNNFSQLPRFISSIFIRNIQNKK